MLPRKTIVVYQILNIETKWFQTIAIIDILNNFEKNILRNVENVLTSKLSVRYAPTFDNVRLGYVYGPLNRVVRSTPAWKTASYKILVTQIRKKSLQVDITKEVSTLR